MDVKHAKLIVAMTEYDRGDPKRIQHFMKVHDYAATIGILEGLAPKTQDILESAAILHDIGIHISEQKYGSCNGKYQEREGPGEARRLMEGLGDFTKEEINRICYLIGHHHTYSHIDGPDYQILVEADFLVNLHEDNCSDHAIENACRNIFKTDTGIGIMRSLFDKKET